MFLEIERYHSPPLLPGYPYVSPPKITKSREVLWVKREQWINLFVHITRLFCRLTMQLSVPKGWLHGSLRLDTTLSFHVQIKARETSLPSPAFFRRGNIVVYEAHPRRDLCWLKTLPNTPLGWLEIQSALAIFVSLLGGFVTCWKKELCFCVLLSLCWWKHKLEEGWCSQDLDLP